LRELCATIERNALINWYFQRTMASLNVCKEYLNMATFKTPVSLAIKKWTFWHCNAFLRHHIQEL